MILQELVAKLGLEVDEGSFRVAEEVMGLAKGGMLAIGAAAAAAATALAAAVAKTAAYADGIEKAAQRTGIGVESLQALQYAAERADVGAEGLQSALNFMAKRGVKDFEEELRRAADELAAMPDGGAKAARAMALFGKQGAALIPMLNKGSDGLDEMTAFAREAGIVLGEDTVASGAALKDALEELQGFIRGLAFTIAGPLLKPVREWLAAAGRWISSNRTIIAQHFERAITLVGHALSVVFRLAEPVVDIVLRLAEAIAESKVAMLALGAVAAYFALPFLAPVAAIGLLLMALEEVWGWVTGKRRTLLEDELGSFEDFKKSLDVINPEDNGFVKAAKLAARGFREAYEWVVALKEEMGFGATPAKVMNGPAARVLEFLSPASGPIKILRSLSRAVDSGEGWGQDWSQNTIPGRPEGSPLVWAPRGPGAPGPTFTLNGGVTVNAAPGADGKSLAVDLVAELDRLWSGKLQEAHAAAKGP